jgi:hypothetical protein
VELVHLDINTNRLTSAGVHALVRLTALTRLEVCSNRGFLEPGCAPV